MWSVYFHVFDFLSNAIADAFMALRDENDLIFLNQYVMHFNFMCSLQIVHKMNTQWGDLSVHLWFSSPKLCKEF
jgi:hypothetical protein